MTNMTVYLGGIKIPRPNKFKRTDAPNKTDIVTLGNNIYTDFVNLSRTWEIGWENMLYADYDAIRTIYYTQFTTSVYPYFTFNAYGIYTQVCMDISPAQLALNGVLIPSFTMNLREATAVS